MGPRAPRSPGTLESWAKPQLLGPCPHCSLSPTPAEQETGEAGGCPDAWVGPGLPVIKEVGGWELASLSFKSGAGVEMTEGASPCQGQPLQSLAVLGAAGQLWVAGRGPGGYCPPCHPGLRPSASLLAGLLSPLSLLSMAPLAHHKEAVLDNKHLLRLHVAPEPRPPLRPSFRSFWL